MVPNLSHNLHPAADFLVKTVHPTLRATTGTIRRQPLVSDHPCNGGEKAWAGG
jgi:hypothetical protein